MGVLQGRAELNGKGRCQFLDMTYGFLLGRGGIPVEMLKFQRKKKKDGYKPEKEV